MELGLLYIAGALLFAGAAGWGMGRSVPSWDIDRENEDTSRYRRHTLGGYRGYGTGGAGCGTLGQSFMRGTGLTVLYVIGAIVLAYYGWGRGALEVESGSIIPVVSLCVAAAIGYVISRVTDKGPVGPLE